MLINNGMTLGLISNLKKVLTVSLVVKNKTKYVPGSMLVYQMFDMSVFILIRVDYKPHSF